jgi:competence protein ComEA
MGTLRSALALAGLLAAFPASAALPSSTPFAAKKPLGPNERIDLNRASTAELMRLPGVGQKRAQAIVAQRTRQPFKRPEDVTAVKGLGPAWFAKVKNHLVVGAAAVAATNLVTPNYQALGAAHH